MEGNPSTFGLSGSSTYIPGAGTCDHCELGLLLPSLSWSEEECLGRLWDDLEAHWFEHLPPEIPPGNPPGLLLYLNRAIMDFKEKVATTAFCRVLHPLDGHSWSQSGPEGNLQHPSASSSGCQHTAPLSAHGLWGKRQLLPPSFPSSCPNKFQTGFSHHIGTLNNAPRCRVCPLSGYYYEQLNFFPPHTQAWRRCILLNSAGQTHSLTMVQNVSNLFLNYGTLLHQCGRCRIMDS